MAQRFVKCVDGDSKANEPLVLKGRGLLPISFTLPHDARKSTFMAPPISYGTAGFRGDAKFLGYIMYRVGILAVLRAKFKKAVIGVMITASHNPVTDNGVKIIDPNGEMLDDSWEQYAELIRKPQDERLSEVVSTLAEAVNVNAVQVGRVFCAYDNRPSSIHFATLVKKGVHLLGGEFEDYGLLTTPQLHYVVWSANNGIDIADASEEGYNTKLTNSFILLNSNLTAGINYNPVALIDAANGVGAGKIQRIISAVNSKGQVLTVKIVNAGEGELNKDCGADHVKIQQTFPNLDSSTSIHPGLRCCSFDGDADRIVYFFKSVDSSFRLLDGDKIAVLMATYLKELIAKVSVLSEYSLGVVQTAYANGSSTKYLREKMNVTVVFADTGVKHLYRAAKQFDIGIYFEANGHGTVMLSDRLNENLDYLNDQNSFTREQLLNFNRLYQFISLINQTVGDAMSDFLAVETILRSKDWDVEQWDAMYEELPSRQLKVHVPSKDRFKCEGAMPLVVEPPLLQNAITAIVNRDTTTQCRAFIRPSGTENIVRVYCESISEQITDAVAQEISVIVRNYSEITT